MNNAILFLLAVFFVNTGIMTVLGLLPLVNRGANGIVKNACTFAIKTMTKQALVQLGVSNSYAAAYAVKSIVKDLAERKISVELSRMAMGMSTLHAGAFLAILYLENPTFGADPVILATTKAVVLVSGATTLVCMMVWYVKYLPNAVRKVFEDFDEVFR